MLHPLSSTIDLDLDREVVVSIIGHGNISLIIVVATIVVGSLLHTSIGGDGSVIVVSIIVRVEEDIALILRAITSIVVIIKLKTVVRSTLFLIIDILSLLMSHILVQLIRLPKKVFTGFALQGVNELGGSTTSVGLE